MFQTFLKWYCKPLRIHPYMAYAVVFDQVAINVLKTRRANRLWHRKCKFKQARYVHAFRRATNQDEQVDSDWK